MTERCLFLATLEIDDPAARVAYLDEACAGDSALRAQVEQLLLAHHETGQFMKRPAPAMVVAGDELVCGSGGTVIGPYRLMEQIGEGGMGLVFVAEQQHPLRRKVAVKVIKPGLDTREVIARFEAERQALALMDHPNIARVLDAGATESGRPYFVMELVRGVAITRFCDENRLTPRERLELFIRVCRAVQHAHQKGIIHRDLKPTNILVTLHDGTPVVKVIDFGVAKAIGRQLSDRTVYTRFAQMIGTPMYMSPEQAEMSGLDIDTRSDIYALGVLLYELLTGATPFDNERLRTAAFDEIRRIVREEDPPRPSERISTLQADALTEVSTRRQTEPKQLSQLVRGELDWIVMKALEKDRNRRYESAGAFADDVRRLLSDEPVLACPVSRWYRFRKLARRNRAVFITSAGLSVGLVLAVATLAFSNVRIREEQRRTRNQKDRAEKAVQLAEDRAREIRRGMERLKLATALVDRARIYESEQRWDDASAAFTEAIQLRPELVPAWEGRGNLYARLGLWERAASDIGKAFDLQEPATNTGWLVLAVLRAQVGDLAGYRAVCRRMADRFEGAAGLRFTMDMVRAGLVAPESGNDPARLVELAGGVVAVEPRDSYYLHTLGAAHYRAGQDERAVLRLRESLEVDPRSEARALNYPLLAMAHHRMGRHDEARRVLDEASRAFDRWTQEMYARGHEGWGIHQGATGSWPLYWWDWVVCQLQYREARAVLGLPPPAEDLRLRVLRARAFAGLRWPDQAVAEYADALKLNPHDTQTRVEAHRSRGFYHITRGEWDRAADEYARACELQPEDPLIWESRAVAHLAAGNVEAYRRVCGAMVERFEWTRDARTAHLMVVACTVRPDAVPDMARLLGPGRVAARWYPGAGRILAAALSRAGACDEAVTCFEEAARHYRLRAEDLLYLAMAHHRRGHTEEARTCLSQAVQWVQEADSREVDQVAGTRPDWGDWEEPIKVRQLLREAETLIRGEKAGSAPKPW